MSISPCSRLWSNQWDCRTFIRARGPHGDRAKSVRTLAQDAAYDEQAREAAELQPQPSGSGASSSCAGELRQSAPFPLTAPSRSTHSIS